MTGNDVSKGKTWLFAFLTVAVATGMTHVLSGLGALTLFLVYFAIVAAGAVATTRLSRASAGRAIGVFLVASVAVAIFDFAWVNHVAHQVARDASLEHAEQTGDAVGAAAGTLVAVVMFIETLVAGIVGALVGAVRRK